MATKKRVLPRLYRFRRGVRTWTGVAFGALLPACAGSAVRRFAGSAPSSFAPSFAYGNAPPSAAASGRRWPESGPPLRVWIEPRTPETPLGADSVTETIVEKALHAWDVSEIPVRVVTVSDSSESDLAVTFVDRFDRAIDGYTCVTWNYRGVLTRGVIQLAIRKQTGQVLSDSARLAVATHEVGHALGLGHSHDSTDVMAPVVRVTHPSAGDVATLRAMYFDRDATPVPTPAVAVAGR